VLSGRSPLLGIRGLSANMETTPITLPLSGALATGSADTLLARLDPAPGLTAADVRPPAAAHGSIAQSDVIRRIMMTPQFQLA